MKQYIGSKTIEAEPMTLKKWSKIDPRMHPAGEKDQDGYFVRYPDGYESWSPKDVFEKVYHELLVLPDGINYIGSTVFPSVQQTIAVAKDDDPDYGGAHRYQFKNSLGFNSEKNEAEYHDSYQEIHFVKKSLNGSMEPGIQSEQLLLALIDRHKKLNAKFPSVDGENAIEHMKRAVMNLGARVRERMNRGVMGDLKK